MISKITSTLLDHIEIRENFGRSFHQLDILYIIIAFDECGQTLGKKVLPLKKLNSISANRIRESEETIQ